MSRCLADWGSQRKKPELTQHGLHLGRMECSHVLQGRWHVQRIWQNKEEAGGWQIRGLIHFQWAWLGSKVLQGQGRLESGLSKEVVWTIDHYVPPLPILSAPLQFPKDKSLQTLSFYPAISLNLVCPLHTELISRPDLVIADCRAICPSPSTSQTSSLTTRPFIMCPVFPHNRLLLLNYSHALEHERIISESLIAMGKENQVQVPRLVTRALQN